MDVDILPGVELRDEGRFTRGAIVSAVRWAVGTLDRDGLTGARVVHIAPGADPPILVAALEPGGDRLVLRGVEVPVPQWQVHAVVRPGEDVPPAPAQRLLRFPLPPAAHRAPLDWLASALASIVAPLGVDVSAPRPPPPRQYTDEDLGQGEQRSVESRAWDAGGGAHVTVEVAEHEIYDGATPRWTVVHGRVTGLPGDSTVGLGATLRDGATASLLLDGPAEIIDRLQPP